MTVRELIELLQQTPQDYEVFVQSPEDLSNEDYFVEEVRKDDLRKQAFITTSY